MNRNKSDNQRNGRSDRTNTISKNQYDKLCKMLSTSALSVAIISWYTTANGLHQYVFESIWQAYIFSAALQGALFVLSIRGIALFLDLYKNIRVLLILIWSGLLCFSSIFSYVYISKMVYSDQLLQEDSHRILNTYCLTENYKLSADIKRLLNGSKKQNGILKDMDEYINQLALLQEGIDLTQGGEDKKLIELKNGILPYAYINNTSNNIIDNCIDTSNIVDLLDKILTVKYTEQDLNDIKDEIQNVTNTISQLKKQKENELKDKNAEKSDYQERLKDFTNTNNPDYKHISELLDDAVKQGKKLNKEISNLETELHNVKRIENVLKSINKSMASALYTNVISLRSAMGKEEIDIKEIKKIVEEIHDTLLENSMNLVADDPRLVNYQKFQETLNKYDAVIKTEKETNREIQELYDLPSVAELKNDSNGNVEWTKFWQMRLNKLKDSVRKLQDGGLDERKVVNLIKDIEGRERLYLSDLNDFERAWNLLFGNKPEHKYKSLLIFSFVFSFGIDLFSVFMSFLMYFFTHKTLLIE